MNLNFRIDTAPYYGPDTIAIHVFGKDPGGSRCILTEQPKFHRITPDDDSYYHTPVPLLQTTASETQQLMDELWRAGFRPRNTESAAGELAAAQRHLADMRALVAGSLGVTLP